MYTSLRIGSAVGRGVFGLIKLGWAVYCEVKHVEDKLKVESEDRQGGGNTADNDGDDDGHASASPSTTP